MPSACCPASASTTTSRSRSRASTARSKCRRRCTARTAAPAANFRIQNRNIFDVSNLDEQGRILPLDDQRRAYRQGNELWHTDSSFRQKSATWSMLHARIIPPDGADTQFADTRAAYDALPEATKAKLEGLIAEHSIWHSRAQLGGYTPTEDEIKARPPARHPRGAAASGLGPQRALHRLARLAHHRLAGRGRPRAAPRIAGARDAAALRLCPQVAARRSGDLGQPLHPAPRHAVRSRRPMSATCGAAPSSTRATPRRWRAEA